jgi:hypothetical protein
VIFKKFLNSIENICPSVLNSATYQHGAEKVFFHPVMSFPRERGSSLFNAFWTPAPDFRWDKLRGSDGVVEFFRNRQDIPDLKGSLLWPKNRLFVYIG